MSKNRKKIIGTLLGIMASVSSVGAMQNAPDAGSDNTGITNKKNEEQKKFKKRGEVKANPYLRVLDACVKLGLINEFLSTTPLRKFSRPFLRQLVTNYRRVHGFSGYVMRHDNPKYTNNVFKLNGDDGHDFRIRVDKGDNLFGDEESESVETLAIESSEFFDGLKGKFELSEYLSEPSINLVAEAKFRDNDGYYRLFEIKAIWNIDDVARAVGQVNKLLDIINNQKIDNDQKKQMIENQFGKNVVFVPAKEGDNIVFRIFLGKKKFPVINVNKVVEEKFFANKIGGDVEKSLNDEDNQLYINEEVESLNKTLGGLDQSGGLNCYAEFKLVEDKGLGAKK